MESIVNFGPNMESFLLTSGLRRWYIVGAYVPPHDAPDVQRIKQVLEVDLKGMEIILLGDPKIQSEGTVGQQRGRA